MLFTKILFSILIIYYVKAVVPQSEWLNSLIDYIQVGSRKYQVFLIFDDEVHDPIINSVLKITKTFPTQSVSFHRLEKERNCLQQHPFLKDPRESSLFIIVPSVNASRVGHQSTVVIDSLIGLSKARTRPKCLFILPTEEKRFAYRRLLRRLWVKQMLDVTILEIDKTPSTDNKFTQKMNQVATLRQFNPFSKIFTKTKRMSPQTVWFPDKLHNLQRQRLKVGIVNLFPLVNLTRNASGHVAEMSGMDVNIIKFMAKEMNFLMEIIPHDTLGDFNCSESQAKHLSGMIARNELNILANSLVGQFSCDRDWREVSRAIDRVSVVAVVPILKNKVSSLIVTGKLVITLALSVALITSLLIVSKILKLNKDVWQPIVLFQILLGYGVENEPRKLADRIIFASMLLTSMILSMNIYEVCTDLSIRQEMQVKMDNLIDLNNSALKPKMTTEMKTILMHHINESHLTVVKKAEGILLSNLFDCYKELAKFRNISCMLTSLATEIAIEKFRDQSGNLIMKVIPEVLQDSWYFLYFERGSPNVPRFNEIFLRMQQSGIRERLKEVVKHTYVKDTDQLAKAETHKISELLRLFFYAFLSLHFVAIVVFGIEIFMGGRNILN